MAKKHVEGVGAFRRTTVVLPATPPSSKPVYANPISCQSSGKKSGKQCAQKKYKSQAK
ncbi:MAG: hypothetical protein ACI4VP_05335 [Clostridia bacterium]